MGPHEYTHWVQYALSTEQLSSARLPYFVVEGSANFFGLALASSLHDLEKTFLDKTLAGHASQMDLWGYGNFGDLTMLKILARGNLIETEALVEQNWPVFGLYAWGTLITEAMVLEVGVDGVVKFWADLFTITTTDSFYSGPLYRAELDIVWMKHFGHSYREVGDRYLPYLSWRAKQLQNAWNQQ